MVQYHRSPVQDNRVCFSFFMYAVGESCGISGNAVSNGICQLEMFPELFRDFVLLFQCILVYV